MKYILTMLLALIFTVSTNACDVCGGAAMNTGFGYIPLQKRHILGMNYNYSSFHTSHPAFGNSPAESSDDRFQSLDLWLRYFATDRLMVSINVPLRYNALDFGSTTYQTNGLGDLRAQLYYGLWRKGSSNSKVQAFWLGGFGIKAPTGDHQRPTEKIIVQNLQLGSGSWDLVCGSNLSIRINDLGFNHEMSYSWNGTNDQDFKFGNQFNTKLISFMQWEQKKNSWVPQVGVQYMHFDQDQLLASQDIMRSYSGRDQVNAVIGLDFYRKSIGFRLNAELPLYHQISQGYVKPNYTINAQLLYFFKPPTFKKKQNESNI